jgi:hypothetical protein
VVGLQPSQEFFAHRVSVVARWQPANRDRHFQGSLWKNKVGVLLGPVSESFRENGRVIPFPDERLDQRVLDRDSRTIGSGCDDLNRVLFSLLNPIERRLFPAIVLVGLPFGNGWDLPVWKKR